MVIECTALAANDGGGEPAPLAFALPPVGANEQSEVLSTEPVGYRAISLIMDNLPIHKVAGVATAMKMAGYDAAYLRYFSN
jgi:hypothetical protein